MQIRGREIRIPSSPQSQGLARLLPILGVFLFSPWYGTDPELRQFLSRANWLQISEAYEFKTGELYHRHSQVVIQALEETIDGQLHTFDEDEQHTWRPEQRNTLQEALRFFDRLGERWELVPELKGRSISELPTGTLVVRIEATHPFTTKSWSGLDAGIYVVNGRLMFLGQPARQIPRLIDRTPGP